MKRVNQFHRKNKSTLAWIITALSLVVIQASAFSLADDRQPVASSEDRIYLVHADSLMFDQFLHPGAQRLSGNVQFQHKGMVFDCDSAVLYEKSESMEAFGHVKVVQGDTLSLIGKYLFYDGNTQILMVRDSVEMRHREQVLLTDSLNYERVFSLGYYLNGGKLVDGENELTSNRGQYYTSTRKSTFTDNVVLVNPQFTLKSDTMHYDTQTKWTHLEGPSNIISGDTKIYTELGFYNSATEQTELYKHSVIVNKETRMTGDSIFYDKQQGLMRAYLNIEYADFKNRNMMYGDFCQYNELTGEAVAYDRALAKDFSNGIDTLYVHADTLRMYTYNMGTDSLYRVMHGYRHVRAYRSDLQAVCDSIVAHSGEHKMTMYHDPIVWSGNRQILGEEINVFSNDSTIDSVYVQRQALMVEQVDSLHYNQVAGQLMRSFFKNGEIVENRVDGNVYIVQYPMEKDSVLLYQNYTETTQIRMFMENRKLKKIWSPAADGCFYPIGMAPPERTRLENFAWFDYIRPRDKNDLFEWRAKAEGTKLKVTVRREAPLQTLQKK